MRTFLIACLFILSSACQLRAQNTIALVDEVLFSSFAQVQADHSGFPSLMGVQIGHIWGEEIGVFFKYEQTVAPTHFSYSTEASSFDRAHFFAATHFEMNFETEFNAKMIGLSLAPTILGVSTNFNMGLGIGEYSVKFLHMNADNVDGSVLYNGQNVVFDFDMVINKKWGPVGLGLNAGYLFANAGRETLDAVGNYTISNHGSGVSIISGASLDGTLDYSGFKLGGNLSVNF